MLVACPTEREIFSPEFHESKKGTGCKEEEKGHEDRSEKSINHKHRIFSAATLLQLKSDAKVQVNDGLIGY